MAIDFPAKVKFGTADAVKGLGSGENDYTVQTELYKFHERLMLFGIPGYKFRGDPPGVNLNNSWLTFMGGNYRLTPAVRASLDFYYQEALFSGADDQVELSAFVGYKLSNRQYLRSYLIKGFLRRKSRLGSRCVYIIHSVICEQPHLVGSIRS